MSTSIASSAAPRMGHPRGGIDRTTADAPAEVSDVTAGLWGDRESDRTGDDDTLLSSAPLRISCELVRD
jgi:hypothetical protein